MNAQERLADALRVLAGIPIDDFGKEGMSDYPLMAWNGHMLTVAHVLEAREALAAHDAEQGYAVGGLVMGAPAGLVGEHGTETTLRRADADKIMREIWAPVAQASEPIPAALLPSIPLAAAHDAEQEDQGRTA